MPEEKTEFKTEFKLEGQPETKTEDIKDDIKWPPLPNGPALFYDDEKFQVWYGIPFEQVNNATIVMAAMDSIKLKVLDHLNSFIKKMIERERFKQSVQGQRANGVMRDLAKDFMAKGKELIGLGKA